jgi:hypothetical protein
MGIFKGFILSPPVWKIFSALSLEGDLDDASAVAQRLNNTSVIGD